MNDWKIAIRSAAIEWTFTSKHPYLPLLFGAFVFSSLQSRFYDGSTYLVAGPDIMFLAFFTIIAITGKKNRLTPHEINDRTMAAAGIVLLRNLPATRPLIAKQQMALFIMQSVFWQGLPFIAFLIWNRGALPFNAPISVIAWVSLFLSFGLVVGSSVVSFGVKRNRSLIYYFIGGLITYIVCSIPITFVIIWSGSNLLTLTTAAANNAPLLTMILSIGSAITALYFSYRMLVRKLRKSDFY